MIKHSDQTWVVYLSTFPPRECGIATFTQDLTNAIDNTFYPRIKSKIIAMNTSESDFQVYPSKVIFEINQNDEASYQSAAQKINALNQVRCVNIQHEYGIHGGLWGVNIMAFLKELKKPSVLTMHTVPPSPDPEMLEITKDMLRLVNKVVVLTKLAKEILIEKYLVDPDKINVIPHGIHPVLFTLPQQTKVKFGYKNKIVLSTFGLLSRNKGIEYVIKALPRIVKKHPNILYLIIGQTHPVVRRKEGESYREELLELVKNLKLTNNVKFFDRYLPLNEIIKFLQATDIYISTSLDPNQTVSGTLSYALGTGRCIVSTAFSQAKEIINDDTGRLVDFRNPDAYADAVLKLLENKNQLEEMYFCAYASTRNMLWSNVAISYINLFNSIAPQISVEDHNLPTFNLDHLRRMTDSYGLFQFAKLTNPDPQYGYTVDDNARALIVVSKYFQETNNKPALTLANTYLNFIEQCQVGSHFYNYISYQQELENEANHNVDLSDSNGRTVWALSELISKPKIPKKLKQKAIKTLQKWIDGYHQYDFPRANAFIIKGLSLLKPRHQISCYKDIIKKSSEYLFSLYKKNSDTDWQWFENSLTYANGIFPEAMFLSYLINKDPQYLKVAESSLEFLINNSFQGPIYVPIGQKTWFQKGDQNRQHYDQQPEDVVAMVQALKTAYKVTKKRKYKNLMFKTFYWFLGNNLLGEQVYDKTTGGSFDGLTPTGVNLHQGAESTVSYLLARLVVGSK